MRYTKNIPSMTKQSFHQPPSDALVKIEITLASTDNVPWPLQGFRGLYRHVQRVENSFRHIIDSFSEIYGLSTIFRSQKFYRCSRKTDSRPQHNFSIEKIRSIRLSFWCHLTLISPPRCNGDWTTIVMYSKTI